MAVGQSPGTAPVNGEHGENWTKADAQLAADNETGHEQCASKEEWRAYKQTESAFQNDTVVQEGKVDTQTSATDHQTGKERDVAEEECAVWSGLIPEHMALKRFLCRGTQQAWVASENFSSASFYFRLLLLIVLLEVALLLPFSLRCSAS